ncbi:hypothetical protein [Rhizobium sp. BK251]|uniref:hypothetical protein n=1 Tax=Rhizobium sp. BK251 TaxID=2512125 RepID=UPI001047D0DE|nr:hypothetical protein [Rhizobium sp. BK251]TCL65721.1 hypothetical protein EV286_11239 [Rhizobium sp. BK251]
MASPWKFLTRLVSPRRQPKQDDRSNEEVVPGALAIAGPTETAVEENFHIADQPPGEQPQAVDRSDAVPAQPEQSGETRDEALDSVESDRARIAPAADPVLPNVGVTAAKVDKTSKAAVPKPRTRAKTVETAEVISQVSPTVPSDADEMTNLDHEINALRTQLANKLRLQNAQLKKMLERFER